MPSKMNDMMSFMNMLKSGNPEQVVMNMLKQQNNNPVAQNLVQLIENGNTSEVEQVVRNVAKEKGIDFDKEFKAFRQMFKL